ncbi:MAG: heterodisulfide reductase-related iron-sulfur binding cluster [Thaumarchaeota archaeon]|nr:heterodisulfide reductase-related iron-sulfur binding cluster [Candidatus Calditenuaceae archaeon]
MELPARDNFALLPPWTEVVMYLVLLPFAVVFAYGFFQKMSEYGLEAVKAVLRNPLPWIRGVMRYAVTQRKLLRELGPGVMHVTLSYGILALFIGTVLVAIDYDIFEKLVGGKLLQGAGYLVFEATLDLFGVLLMYGVIVVLVRRYAGERRLRSRLEYYSYLYGIAFIGITGFVLEGLRLYLTDVPWGGFSFVGQALSVSLSTLGVPEALAGELYPWLWWSHAIVAFSLVAAIPYTNLLHTVVAVFYAGLSYSAPRPPVLAKTPFKLEELDPEAEVRVGFRKVGGLDWYQRMGLDACTDCGRCEAACPAFASGTPLSPRMVVQKLRFEMWRARRDGQRDVFESGVLTYEELFACTTCGACTEVCPVTISPMEYILEARRALTFEGRLEKRAVEALTNLGRTGNMYGLQPSARQELLSELRALGVKTIEEHPDAEYVYWVGCLSTFDQRARQITKRLSETLVKAGLNFAVLGPSESCTGESARRMGEEGRFQEQAYRNVETLRALNAKKVITHCPHCYQVLRNEYREFGLDLQVVHHSVLLGELVRAGKIKVREAMAVTLHDSCYIARHNGIVEEPRVALSGTEVREMPRRGRDTFCCGGGGGNYWYEVKRIKRESVQRVEEAMSTGAKVIVTECPFCLAMMEDAVRVMGAEGKVEVKDIAELF